MSLLFNKTRNVTLHLVVYSLIEEDINVKFQQEMVHSLLMNKKNCLKNSIHTIIQNHLT